MLPLVSGPGPLTVTGYPGVPKGLGLQVHWLLRPSSSASQVRELARAQGCRGLSNPTAMPAFADLTENEGYRLEGAGRKFFAHMHPLSTQTEYLVQSRANYQNAN